MLDGSFVIAWQEALRWIGGGTARDNVRPIEWRRELGFLVCFECAFGGFN